VDDAARRKVDAIEEKKQFLVWLILIID